MPNYKIATGELGEIEVVKLVPCPNCSKQLMKLPKGFPMYDVQCSGCLFRAQVKTTTSSPRNSIRGAGWDIYEKVMKAGYLSPALFINFRWFTKEGLNREIRFYPFIAKGNIKMYQLPPEAKRANYKMFRYVKLNTIPYFVLYKGLDQFEKV